jgi:sterol 3beta-glucosyltransferase
MKIAILTIGTRGDVEPFAVLGQALAARGHRVTLCTARNFENLVRSYGVGFRPVDADLQALVNSEEGSKMLKANLFAIRRNLRTVIYPLIERLLQDFYELARESDRILYRPKTLADVFADQFPDKMVKALVVPATHPTSRFPNPLFSGFGMPTFLNRLSYRLNNLDHWVSLLNEPVANFRRRNGLSVTHKSIQAPFVYGLSEHFLPKPDDLPNDHHFTGFWFGSPHSSLSPETERFLRNGEPPLAVTFGSMPFESNVNLSRLVNETAKRLKTRMILVKGWGMSISPEIRHNKDVLVLDSAPYDALFPHVQAVVHHGGIGTTAQCLRAGKPMLVCPVLYPVGDQQFWGEQAVRKGVGVKPVPVGKITRENFAHSVAQLLYDDNLYENSQRLAALIAHENGVEQALRVVEREEMAVV